MEGWTVDANHPRYNNMKNNAIKYNIASMFMHNQTNENFAKMVKIGLQQLANEQDDAVFTELVRRINRKIEIEDITITISESTQEPGYLYDVYTAAADEVAEGDIDARDGGICTGNIADAIDMAYRATLNTVTDQKNEVTERVLVTALETFIESCGLDQIDAHNQAKALLSTLNGRELCNDVNCNYCHTLKHGICTENIPY